MTDLTNSLVTKAAPFIQQIEDIESQIDTLTGEHMARIKKKRAERKEVFSAAKDAGVDVRPLKGIVKRRTLERKIKHIPDDFDIDEAAAYRELAEGALGDLGVVAARAAGYTNGDDRDLRPPHMRRTEQERAADAANLEKVGRGQADPIDSIR